MTSPREKNDIVGAFVGCLVRAKIGKWEIIWLCYNMFDLVWLEGLEQAFFGIDDKLKIPLLEVYMSHPPGSFELAIVARRPSLVIGKTFCFSMNGRKWR